MSRNALWIIPVVVLALVADRASAQDIVTYSIPVVNWDFEMAYDCGGVGAQWGFSTMDRPDAVAIPGWTRVIHVAPSVTTVYAWTGVAPCTYFDDPNVGGNCAYSNGGEIRQILTAVLLADTDYELSVDGGWMTGSGGGTFNKGYIELWASGVLLGREQMAKPPQGYWTPTVLSLTATDIAAAVGVTYGTPLEIRLVSESNRICFDNVKLTATGPIPEPATMSLLALGGLALLRRRGR